MSSGRDRLLPGRRFIWVGALLAAIVGAIAIGASFAGRHLPLTGTNSVDVGAVVATTTDDHAVCARGLTIPEGTGRIQLFMGYPGIGSSTIDVTGTLRSGATVVPLRAREADEAGRFRDLTIPRTARSLPGAVLCLRSIGHAIAVGGASVQRLPGEPVSTVDGRPLAGVEVAVRYLTPEDERAGTFLSRLGSAFSRAARFPGYPGGSFVLWACLGAFVLAAYAAARVAATAELRALSARRLALYATLVAFGAGTAWALMAPPFFGADESEHFAYAQHLAATGHRADASSTSTAPPYSTDETYLLGALHHNSTILNADSRPRWDGESVDAYHDATRGRDLPDGDGGGYTESASGHAPLYYAIVGLPYRVLHGHLGLPGVVVAMRLLNAALASLIAGLAVLIASMLFRNRAAWWFAGMLVAGQPVFDSVAGTINNDTLVNVLAAGTLWALVHAWARGPSPRNVITAAICVGLLPVAKVTGFALWPVAGVGALIVVWRHHGRRALALVGAAGAGAAALAVLWVVAFASLFGGGRGTLYNIHPGASVASDAPVTAGGLTVLDRVDYAVQTFVPFVHLQRDVWTQRWPFYDIYIERGFGSFGWLNAGLSPSALHVVFAALVAGWALVVVAAFTRRGSASRWAPGAAILVLAVLAVLGLVAYAYTALVPRAVPGEQGRYAFPALAALAVLFAAAPLALPSKARDVGLGLGATVMPLFACLGWLAAVGDWFT